MLRRARPRLAWLLSAAVLAVLPEGSAVRAASDGAGATAAPAAAASPAAPPPDKLERGLMMEVEEAERRVKLSPLVITDARLNSYIQSVLCRLVGQQRCAAIRIYVIRTPEFNASVSPNGSMEVWSGLLLRTRNEAQLATVLAHEFAHYEKRHTVAIYRDLKSKSNSAGWLALTGVGLIAAIGMQADYFRFSREMEREADLEGLKLLAGAGYDTREAARIWEQLRQEMDATAQARGKASRKDKDRGMFASHPPTAERVSYLVAASETQPGVRGATGEDELRRGLGPWWATFIDDQLRRNDLGGSDYLLGSLASGGWTPRLLYARGELYRRRGSVDDLTRAARYYSDAIDMGTDLAETWRGRGMCRHKLGLTAEGNMDFNEYLRRAPQASDREMIQLIAGGNG